MNICLLGPTYPFRGGIAHYNTLLYLELKRKHKVHLISLSRQYPSFLFPGKTQYDTSKRHIEVENLPMVDSINPWTWLKSALHIYRLKPDLLVIQWWHPFFGISFGTIALLVRRLARIKVCFLCHNVMPHERSLLDRLLTGYGFASAEYFIVHSLQDEALLKKMRAASMVERVPHSTYSTFSSSDELTREEARKQLGLHQEKTVLFFGYIRPYKGLSCLLQSLSKVVFKLDCILYVVGEFYENKQKYIEEIKSLGLENRVRVIDRYVPNEEVPVYFQAADLVALPYRSATQSGVIQMAYGFNTPVITTNVGGLPEAVEEGVTGYTVPPDDPGALGEAIVRFFEKDQYEAFSRNIKKLQHTFSWDKPREAIERMINKTQTEKKPF